MGSNTSKSLSAGDVLWPYLREHAERLAVREAEVRADEPDGIHQMRVESRRLRTALAVYRRLLDEEQAREMQAELTWFARALSPARDLEVVEEQITEAIDAEPRSLIAGPVRMLPKRRLKEAAEPARAAAFAALDSPRYAALRERLDAFVADPPWSEKAARPAAKVLPKRVAKPWRRIQQRVEAVAEAEPRNRDVALHEVRKAAKRLRYACDIAAPELGPEIERLSRKAEAIQDMLGHHQDMVVLRQWLRRLSRDPEAGAAVFTFGRCHRWAQELAARDVVEFEEAWSRLYKRASDLLPAE